MLRIFGGLRDAAHDPITWLMALAGGVSVKRRYRARGKSVNRPPDLEGIARITDAIRRGWLLHFPTGTTRHRAPVRRGVARLLYDTRAVWCRSAWTGSAPCSFSDSCRGASSGAAGSGFARRST